MERALTTTVKSGYLPDTVVTAGRWRVENDLCLVHAEEGLARDIAIAHAVANGAAPTYRLWQSRRALVVSRHELQLPNVVSAIAQLNASGWPVVVRTTGGTAVPLTPGVLNISLALPRSEAAAAPGYCIDTVYAQLCAPVQRALLSVRIPTEFGSVPGAFCDGRYNLASDRKKIAGTAQVWRANVGTRGTSAEGYVLAHAALLVDVDPGSMTEVVNRFYRLAGTATRLSDSELTSVRRRLKYDQSLIDKDTDVLISQLRSRIITAIESDH